MQTLKEKLQKANERIAELETDSGWLDLELANGITKTGLATNVKYRKIGKIIFLRGSVGGISALNTVIATLPERV